VKEFIWKELREIAFHIWPFFAGRRDDETLEKQDNDGETKLIL
jgi:hypothetical protein